MTKRARSRSWKSIAERIARRLPFGWVRFQTVPAKRNNLTIVATYPNEPPAGITFTLMVATRSIDVVVITRRQPTLPVELDTARAARFDSVYPGAAIAVDLAGGVRESGAICALLSAAADDQRPTHVLTCGHMFPRGATGMDVVGGVGGLAQVIGTLQINLLEKSPQRDVALVLLSDDARSEATRHGRGPLLSDYLDQNVVFDREAYTFRATTNAYSAKTTTLTATTNARVAAAQWPGGFDVVGGIATANLVSIEGDSGTILCFADKTTAIGSCSASGGGESLFEPIGRALDEFTNLTLWRNR